MEVLAAFLVGVALGACGAYAYFDAWRMWMRDEATRWETARTQEIRELRAQVARLIGANATPTGKPAPAHSACQSAQADCARNPTIEPPELTSRRLR